MKVKKICPIMSHAVLQFVEQNQVTRTTIFHEKECIGERCMAWEAHKPVDEYDEFVGGRCRLIP